MKTLNILILLWPAVVFAQERPILSVGANEVLDAVFLDNFRGIGQQDICAKIYNRDTYGYRLSFLDPGTRRELAGASIPLEDPSDWYAADIDGNGVTEIVVFNTQLFQTGKPGFVVFQLNNGLLFQNTYDEFWGAWGRVGDITGNGRDELILHPLPQGYANYGGTGPIDIQVISWKKSEFELIASASLPTMYLRTEVADLDNNGQAEIIALKSGRRDDQHRPLTPLLAVYAYTDNPELTLIDEIEIPMNYDDNLNLLWIQPLPGSGYRVIVPIPEEWVDGMTEHHILEYQGFRLIDNRLTKESNPLDFKWKFYEFPLTPLKFPSDAHTMDIDNDGASEVFQIRDGKYLELVKKLPPALPKR